MLKRVITSSFAILVSIATLLSSAYGQDAIGLGQAEYVDQYDAIVVGQTDFFPAQPVTYLVTLTDEFGNVTNGIADVAEDGSFILVSSKEMIKGSLSFVEGTFFEQNTGNPVSDFEIAVLTDFEKWFDKWKHDDLEGVDTVAELPTGRPCLYRHTWLEQNDNWKNVSMTTGDYFPNWKNWTWTKNKKYVEALLEQGKPVKDTYANSDGTVITAGPTVTITKERKILTDGGYVRDDSIPGWKVPDGYVWDAQNKKWVAPQ